ncbi:multicopper oxidase family protein [Synechococcus sp. CCY9201]|uniref:multicopper oxidase family protein n=1 Tax=Synechococcus sp. CCY9201 TaxID=174697 RepID=UPI002B2152F2|nr:multicopper oxidase family protein [Synechococcus sp. CCY9201]MEA5475765.1 multicopper oxidase family protein [Synechococcus sp. CCY9201]
MARHISRRSFLALAAAGAGGLVLGRGALCRAQPSAVMAGPAVIRSSGGLLDLDLVAGATPGWLPQGPSWILTYNGRSPGPRLEVRPGDAVRLRFRNTLEQPSNLHYHGLHVSPGGSADNVFLSIPGGESFAYAFEIPADHPAGLFYYHPHRHGTVSDQVFGGLGGMLVVRGELDELPEVRAAREEFLFLKDFPAATEGSTRGYGFSPMQRIWGRQGELLTVNGQIQPNLQVSSGGLLRLRLVNASNARFYRLALEGHPFHLIATDGGAIPAPIELQELLLAPGERADVLVQANRSPGRYRLQALPYDRLAGGMGMGRGGMDMGWRGGRGRGGMGRGEIGMGRPRGFLSQTASVTLATVSYVGEGPPMPLPRQLIAVPALPEPTRTRSFSLSHAMGPGMGMAFLINNNVYEHARMDTTVRLNETEEWILLNSGMMDHPFHVHVNPFQVISRNGQPEPFRAWKDTVVVRPGEEVRIRTVFLNFPGRTVYHCHILDHEELGMMGTLEISA